MATFDYGPLSSTVKSLLNKFGTTRITQIRQVASEWEAYPDPTTNTMRYKNTETGEISDTVPANLPTEITVDGVITNFNTDSRKDFLVNVGDKLLLLSDINPPEVGDVFEVNGVKHNYVNHMTVNPAETTLLYKVQVRV